MSYYAVQEGSNYAVYKDGQRVSTTTASGLSTWGLSPTNLGSATSSPSPTQSTYVAPQTTYTAPSTQTSQQTTSPSVLFSAYGQTIYSNATVSLGQAPDGSGQAVYWKNPDGSYVWAGTSNPLVTQYAPQYKNKTSATSSTATAPTTQATTTTQATSVGGYPPTTALQPGATGTAVKQLQDWLVSRGYMTQEQVNTGYGTYGPQTTAAVNALQQALGVNNSSGPGYWGPLTIQAAQQNTSGMGYWTGPSGQYATSQVPGNTSSTSTTSSNQTLNPFTQQLQPAPTDNQSNFSGSGSSTSAQVYSQGSPYFMGNEALVMFTDGMSGQAGSVYWVLDKPSGTLRPVASMQGLQAIFGTNLNSALSHVMNISSPAMNQAGLISGGPLGGFYVLGPQYAINDDGTAKPLTATPSQLASTYGKTPNSQAENNAATIVHNLISMAENNPDTFGLDPQLIQSISTDQPLMAAYVNAIAYGGYSPGDIYSDIKRQTLVEQGNSQMEGVTLISPTMNRTQYISTNAGKQAYSNTNLQMPQTVAATMANNLGLTIYSTPDSLYQTPSTFVGQTGSQTTIPTAESMTPDQLNAALSKIDSVKAAYYDVLQQQLTASTEQEQAVAQYNWNQFKDYTEKNLGINLSNDAMTAWGQIQSLESQYGSLNLGSSGMENESIDEYLAKIRNQDSQYRDQAQTNEKNAQYTYYTQYATPDQIKQFTDSNPDLAKQWGLVPSDTLKASLTPSALMAKYPGLTSAQASSYISALLDQNGNYRSSLYQKYMTQQLPTQPGASTTLFGQEYQDLVNSMLGQSTNSITNSRSTYTNDPFVRPTPGTTPVATVGGIAQTSGNYTPTTSPTATSFAGTGAGNNGITYGATTPTSTPQQPFSIPSPISTYKSTNQTTQSQPVSNPISQTTASSPLLSAPKSTSGGTSSGSTGTSIPWNSVSLSSAAQPSSNTSSSSGNSSGFSLFSPSTWGNSGLLGNFSSMFSK